MNFLNLLGVGSEKKESAGNSLSPPSNNGAKADDSKESSSGNATGSGRTKVALKPGHSLMDWVRLCKSSKDMAGTGGKLLTITPQELAKHYEPEDCWCVIRGRVYNITPYLNFHPGGVDMLLQGGGIDATELFDEHHAWVNFESMLEKCLVGRFSKSLS